MATSLLRIYCEESSCPLYDRRDCVPCEIRRQKSDDDRLDILFIGEAPGSSEVDPDTGGRPFIGVSGTLLRRALRFAQRDNRYNIGFSNVIRCLPLNGDEIRKPTNREMHNCRHFLDRDIERTDPKVIVLLGKSSVQTFLSGGSTVTEQRGKYHMINIAGRDRIVFTTWHPAYVGRQKKILPIWYDDIRTAFKLADGWLPDPSWAKIGESRLLKTVNEVEEYIDFLRRGLTLKDMVSVDVETKNLNKIYGNQLGLIQFAYNGDEATCIPLDHPETPFAPDELEIVRALLRRLFTKKVSFGHWLAHNGKFEQILIGHHIMRNGGRTRTFKNVPMRDTMAFSYLLNENKVNLGKEAEGYRLKDLARHFLRFEHYDEETLKAREGGSLFDLPLESSISWGQKGWQPNLTDYGGMDGYVTWRLFHALKEEALEQRYYKKAMGLLDNLFSPTFRLLSTIERNGFWANLGHLKMLKDPARSPILKRLEEIDRVSVKDFDTAKAANEKLMLKQSGGNRPLFGESWVLDLNKPEHRREWLVNQCKLEAPTKTESGLPSVGKAFYQEHDGVPEVELVKERQGLSKLASSYINQLIEFIDPRYRYEDCQDGRVRPDFWFTSTVSGRGSCSNPNMQQQVRGDSPEKAAIKSIFQAEQPGVQESLRVNFKKGPPRAYKPQKPRNTIVQLDFMTNEVRWWAILSGCPDLAKALNNGKRMRDAYRADPDNLELKAKADIEGDLHKNTASLMYGVPISEVEKQMRTAAKSIVFGWMFGRGNHAIAAQIHKTIEETEKLVEQFGNTFPVGRDWLHSRPEFAQKHWFVESPIGRRRRLPGYLVLPYNWLGMSQDEQEYVWRGLHKDDKKLVGECNRMAMNSAIQGVASDAAFIGAALFADYIEDHGKEWLVQNVVHDSCVYQVPIVELEESLHVAEQTFTVKTMDYMTEHWGVEFNCPVEVDFEIGLTWGGLKKWDYTKRSLDEITAGLLS